MKIKISRLLPEDNNKQYFQEFVLDKGKGETVLGLLKYIEEEKDSSLSFRYNCRNEHCGECGIRVNGRPVLACREIVNSDSVIIKPLARFPVLKDLVVDLNTSLDRLYLSMPLLKSGYNNELDPEIYDSLFLAGRCNTCFLCQSSCHLFKSEEEKIAGPAFYVLFSQYLLRPMEKDESFFFKLFEHKFLQCTLCGNCSKYCPLEVDPQSIILALLEYICRLGLKIDPSAPLIQAALKKKTLSISSVRQIALWEEEGGV